MQSCSACTRVATTVTRATDCYSLQCVIMIGWNIGRPGSTKIWVLIWFCRFVLRDKQIDGGRILDRHTWLPGDVKYYIFNLFCRWLCLRNHLCHSGNDIFKVYTKIRWWGAKVRQNIHKLINWGWVPVGLFSCGSSCCRKWDFYFMAETSTHVFPLWCFLPCFTEFASGAV